MPFLPDTVLRLQLSNWRHPAHCATAVRLSLGPRRFGTFTALDVPANTFEPELHFERQSWITYARSALRFPGQQEIANTGINPDSRGTRPRMTMVGGATIIEGHNSQTDLPLIRCHTC